jgi:formamidopyrimidine-DNA glycosylase
MPELPEVEVTRLSFAQRIAGSTVETVALGKPLRWPLGCNPQQLVGMQVLGVRRRGKYLLLDLTRGLLLMHLGMSGSITFATRLDPRGPHDHFEMQTDHGLLRLHDPRRFGAVVYATAQNHPVVQKLLGGLGVEPLSEDFLLAPFHAGLQSRTTAIKQVLLAGDLVVGVGNIYASEALFTAGIRPTLPSCRLSKPRAARLHAAIQQVLSRALAQGGTTLRDFSDASGQTGYFQLQTSVYGRAGLPCLQCKQAIKRIRQGQRATYYCPVCQRR